MNPLTRRVNSYIAMLCITAIGSGAAMLIMHVANAADNTFVARGDLGQANAYLHQENAN